MWVSVLLLGAAEHLVSELLAEPPDAPPAPPARHTSGHTCELSEGIGGGCA